jgi:hypothetical protein
MRTIGLVCVAFVVGLAGAWTLATPQSKAATETILTQVTTDDLQSILTEWGATEISAPTAYPIKGSGGEVAITIRYLTFKHNGIIYAARLYCPGEGAGCLCIQLTASFEAPNTALSVVNNYNGKFRAGKAVQDAKGYVSERYIIVDNGVARGNIMTQLVVHEGVTANLMQFIKENGIVAQAPAGRPIPVTLQHIAAQGTTLHTLTAEDVQAMPMNNRIGR